MATDLDTACNLVLGNALERGRASRELADIAIALAAQASSREARAAALDAADYFIADVSTQIDALEAWNRRLGKGERTAAEIARARELWGRLKATIDSERAALASATLDGPPPEA